MSKLLCGALCVVAVLLLTQTLAWSAVTISWTDVNGYHSQNLYWLPIDPGDPLYIFDTHTWVGTLNIEVDTFDPIALTVTGDYMGDDGFVYPHIWLRQNVLNSTPFDWTDFHLHVESGEFGWVEGYTNNWNINQPDFFNVVYEMPQGGTPVYHQGTTEKRTFKDGIFIFEEWDWVGPEAEMVITKWPTGIVPEAGGAAVLCGGLLGILGYARRRLR